MSISENYNLIPYHQINLSNTREKLKNLPIDHIQRAILVSALACSVISLIPGIGLFGALSLRTIAIGAVGVEIAGSIKNGEGPWLQRAHVVRLAGSLIGFAGVASGFTPLVVTALALELLYQAGETAHGTYNRDLYKALSQSGFLLIDTFTLVGMLTGAWPYIVTAATLNSIALFVFGSKAIVDAVRNEDPNYALDAACYFLLGGISIGAAVRSAELSKRVATKYQYTYTNRTGSEVTLKGNKGNVIMKVKPGETVKFSLDPGQTINRSGRVSCKGFNLKHRYLSYSSRDMKKVITQPAMTQKTFPTLPIDSTAALAEEPKWKVHTDVEEENVDLAKTLLESYLKPTLNPPVNCFLFDEDQPRLKLRCGEKECSFALENILQLSGYLQSLVRVEQGKTEYELVLEGMNPNTFDRIARILQRGEPGNLEGLAETDLLDLFDASAYLQLEDLRLLCLQEVARRLKAGLWKETRLFTPYYDTESSLKPLIELFSFNREGN